MSDTPIARVSTEAEGSDAGEEIRIDSKKVKKYEKRSAKGDISTRVMYAELRRLRVAHPEVSVVVRAEASRAESVHDLNIEEVTELITSIVQDVATSKYFHIRNKGAIQHVSLVHVSDCDLDDAELRDAMGAFSVVRLARHPGEVLFLPRQLLSTPIDVNAPAPTRVKLTLEDCVLDKDALKLWGFPSPATAAEAGDCSPDSLSAPLSSTQSSSAGALTSIGVDRGRSSPAEEGVADDETDPPRAKSPRLSLEDHSSVKGALAWAFPSPALASASLQLITRIDARSGCAYRATLSRDSTEYAMLCASIPSPSSSGSGNVALPLAAVAIDCEMCDTKNGLELTRVSLVSLSGELLLDTFVKPADEIVDYRSQWSGVTSEVLRCVTHSIEQVQVLLLRLVSSETALIGHSLDSDLKAVRLLHSLCVDTSILYPHPRGYPFRNKLKYLAAKHLSLQIQRADAGHDSAEDARTAVALLALKMDRGAHFGLPGLRSRESVLEGLGDRCFSSFCWSDEDDAKHMQECLSSSARVDYDEHFHALRDYIRGRHAAAAAGSAVGVHYTGLKWSSSEALASALARYASAMRSVYGEATGLMIVTYQRPLQPVFELLKRRRACGKAMGAAMWSSQNEEELQSAMRTGNLPHMTVSIV